MCNFDYAPHVIATSIMAAVSVAIVVSAARTVQFQALLDSESVSVIYLADIRSYSLWRRR